MINDRYKIKKKLGTGRSHVYLCTDIYNPSKDIAIKVLSNVKNEKELKSFRDEFFLLKKINHPNIVKVYEYGTILKSEKEDAQDLDIVEGRKFFTMEFLPGQTLNDFKIGGDLSLIFSIIEQICSVLYYLHQSNYIYYDLKPENILVQSNGSSLKVYFFDFGFTKFIPSNDPFEVQGTPHYIAPEILQLNKVDHRADLYSLGIMLYNLIYGRFPFSTENELVIYKANIEENFEYPEKQNFEKLIAVAKKLLNKSPEERYKTSLEVLEELDIPISHECKNTWLPVKTFSGRDKIIYEINSNIYDKHGKEVIIIQGSEGSGKTQLLTELNFLHPNSVLIRHSDINTNNCLWRYLLRKILYSENIYPKIEINLQNEIKNLLTNDINDLSEKLKSVVLRLSRDNRFVLLLDDFNCYDEFSIEILRELVPILQVNGVTVVISEDTDKPLFSDFIKNYQLYNLNPFTEEELNEFFRISFFTLFPDTELKTLVKKYSDLLPGNLYELIKNLISLDILQYDYSNIKIVKDPSLLSFIEKNQTQIYELKIKDLSADEVNLLNLISLFNVNLTASNISKITDIEENQVENYISNFVQKGILVTSNTITSPKFTSIGLKDFIYGQIPNKKEKHLELAEKLVKLIPDFNRIECSRQFELAGDYHQCYNVLKEELINTESSSPLTYQKKLLEKLLSFPLEGNEIVEIEYLLSNILFQLSEDKKCLALTNNLLSKEINGQQRIELMLQKGKCLIRVDNYKEGINLLKSILPDVNDPIITQRINVEIADAELYLNNFTAVDEICKSIIDERNCLDETKAKAYSLLALVALNEKNNIASAIYNFQYALNMYEKANLPFFVAAMEMNIGNIINMKGNLVEAEKHWQASYKINESIGNLNHEAKLLLNYGVFYFNSQQFDKSIQRYQRAESIFLSMGNSLGRGLSLANIGEVYSNICEYDLAFKNLELARNIFIEIDNKEEEAESVFLLGQYYFNAGDEDGLNNMVSTYENMLKSNSLVEKHSNNISYLRLLKLYLSENFKDLIENADKVIEIYKKQNDMENNSYFAKSCSLLVKSLLKQNMLDNALGILNNRFYLSICEKNVVMDAERKYLLGLVSELDKTMRLEPCVDYFNKALNLIEKQYITELTWEINFSLAKFFFKRGNYKRFMEYSAITKSLLNFISSKINSRTLRTKYLNSFTRRDVIETLEGFERAN